jgi:membrane protein DedA with SNARE-associated domain
MSSDTYASTALAAGIVLGSLVSEDAATIGAASLSAAGAIDSRLAFVSAFAGVWFGDAALYVIARGSRGVWAQSRWLRSFSAKSSGWITSIVEKWGALALLASRFVPGTRLPATLAAGAVRMPASSFLSTTALGALIWIGFNFAVVGSALRRGRLAAVLCATVATVLGAALARSVNWAQVFRRVTRIFRRWSRWEFWPGCVFYTPVVLMCAWLSVRFRGLALPALANPSQRNGGVIGESKADILLALQKTAPDYVASTVLIEEGTLAQRMRSVLNALLDGTLQLPFVLKPNVGQRGAGFRKIASLADAEQYLREVSSPVVAQAYAAGPYEAGIFYYRFPHEQRGHILAITDKIFPVLRGDGTSTIGELIDSDERASLIARTYLQRLGSRSQDVLPLGETVKLVEAGNHCQGCIFRDGAQLYSEQLLESIDGISQSLPGFYIGRYDIRYANTEDLRAGRGFTIIELNGAASEATSIYDSRNSIFEAYRMLYRQWKLVYAIGAANRTRGFRAPGAVQVFQDWLAYERTAQQFPIAD